MSLTLTNLNAAVRQTIGDQGLIDIEDANITMALNWALVEAARLTRMTKTVRTISISAGASFKSVAPALEIISVVML